MNFDLVSQLAECGMPHAWHIDAGGHTFPVWRNDLYHFSMLLFRWQPAALRRPPPFRRLGARFATAAQACGEPPFASETPVLEPVECH